MITWVRRRGIVRSREFQGRTKSRRVDKVKSKNDKSRGQFQFVNPCRFLIRSFYNRRIKNRQRQVNFSLVGFIPCRYKRDIRVSFLITTKSYAKRYEIPDFSRIFNIA